MLSKIKRHHIGLLAFLGVLLALGTFLWQNDINHYRSSIRPFNQDKDFISLTKLINANKFFLSENPNFPTEKFLLWRAPAFDPSKKGQARLEVIEVDGVTAGFISFYRKSLYEGYIWLLAVDSAFRSQGLGKQLMQFAEKELKKQGVRYIRISTRTINKPALKLYKNLGYVTEELYEERGMINLIKRDL